MQEQREQEVVDDLLLTPEQVRNRHQRARDLQRARDQARHRQNDQRLIPEEALPPRLAEARNLRRAHDHTIVQVIVDNNLRTVAQVERTLILFHSFRDNEHDFRRWLRENFIRIPDILRRTRENPDWARLRPARRRRIIEEQPNSDTEEPA